MTKIDPSTIKFKNGYMIVGNKTHKASPYKIEKLNKIQADTVMYDIQKKCLKDVIDYISKNGRLI